MEKVNTPYDDVFRTLLVDSSKLIIPVVNELFNKDYTGEEEIILSQNEHFMTMQDGESEERITDSYFLIIENEGQGKLQITHKEKFHIECQSSEDGSMVIRMFEYDTQIAIEDSEYSRYHLKVNLPHSAVIFLRHNKTTPNHMKITINTSGGNVTYKIPVLKTQNYSIDEIFEKNLLFLIPFYIFSYEKNFGKIESEEIRLEELKTVYQSIIKKLEDLVKNGKLSEFDKCLIVDMSKKVVDNIAIKYDRLKREVKDIMGGKVLEYEAKTIRNQGREEGRELGLEQGLEQGLKQGLEQGRNEGIKLGSFLTLKKLVNLNVITVEEAATQMNCSVDEFMTLEKL